MWWMSTLHGLWLWPIPGRPSRRGLGIRLTSSTGTSASVTALPADKQGAASAMNDASREVGAAIGVAVMGSVDSSTYKDSLPEAPSTLPPEIVETIEHSAAGDLEVARQLAVGGGTLTVAADQLAAAIPLAFMDGLSASLIAVAVSALLVLVEGVRSGP